MRSTEQLQADLSIYQRTKLFRGIVGWIGAGLYVSGVFTNISGALSEIDHSSMAEEFGRTSCYYNESLCLQSNKIISDENNSGAQDIVAGFVSFDTSGVVNILESSGCSSITDNGAANYAVNFIEPLGDYLYTLITSEPIKVISASMGDGYLNLIFDKPLSGIIKILFFKKVLTSE